MRFLVSLWLKLCREEDVASAMDSLELSHKILLSECILYQDFMGHRFLDSFDKLKANKDADLATRFCEADALLGQLHNTLKDFKFPAEWELEFCKAVTSKTDDSAKWLYLLEDNNRIQVFEDWFERCPRFTSILPWFVSQSQLVEDNI